MTAKIILNPYSNRWNAKKRWPEAEAALHAAGVEFDLAISEYPRHTTSLAEQAARQGFSPVVAAGGDGTIGEVVNGLARAAVDDQALLGPFGVLPLGSANDLVDNLGLPKDLADAARVIAAGKTRRMDIGSVNGLYFANNSAIGLEPYITLVQQRITWIKGMLRYLVAAVVGIMDKPLWSAEITWDGGQYKGEIILVTVGNGARTGGVFYMAPHADLFDGKLTFVHGLRRTRHEMFAILPKTMKRGQGNYVETKDIHEENSSWIKIHVDSPTPAHIDGEIFSEAIQDLDYHIHPGRLQILTP
jgi:diacylglycerol kinase (ATP)